MRQLEIQKGEHVYSIGETPGSFFKVVRGEIFLQTSDSKGREFIFERVIDGFHFGHDGFLCGGQREENAIANEFTIVTEIWEMEEAITLDLLLESNRKLMSAKEKMRSLAMDKLNSRFAKFLIMHHRAGVIEPYSHDEIGAMLGVARESISYKFAEFRKNGLIKTESRTTTLLNIDGLSMASKGEFEFAREYKRIHAV